MKDNNRYCGVRRVLIGVSLLVIAFRAEASQPLGANDLTSKEVLIKARAALAFDGFVRKTESVCIESVVRNKDEEDHVPVATRQQSLVINSKGQFLRATKEREGRPSATRPSLDVRRLGEGSCVTGYNGKTVWIFVYYAFPSLQLYENADADAVKFSFLSSSNNDDVFDSVLYSEPKPILDLLQDGAENAKLEMVHIKDSELLRLVENTQYGLFELVLDPTLNFAPRQFTITKQPGDLLGDKTVREQVRLSDSQMSPGAADVELWTYESGWIDYKQIDGRWIPWSAAPKHRTRRIDGTWQEVRYDIQRTAVEFSEDKGQCAKLQPIAVEGSEVVMPRNPQPVPLTWHEGRIQPRVDDATVDDIRKHAGS